MIAVVLVRGCGDLKLDGKNHCRGEITALSLGDPCICGAGRGRPASVQGRVVSAEH